MTVRNQCLPCTTELLHIQLTENDSAQKACLGSSQTGCPDETGKCIHCVFLYISHMVLSPVTSSGPGKPVLVIASVS